MDQDKGNNPTDPVSTEPSIEGVQLIAPQTMSKESIIVAGVGDNGAHTTHQDVAPAGDLQEAGNKKDAEALEHTAETSRIAASSNSPPLSPNPRISSNEPNYSCESTNPDAATHIQIDAPANIASGGMDLTHDASTEEFRSLPMDAENLPLNNGTAPATNPPENPAIISTQSESEPQAEAQVTNQAEENGAQNGADSEYEIEDETIIDSAQIRNPDQPTPSNPTNIPPFTNTPDSTLIHDTIHSESSQIVQTDILSLTKPAFVSADNTTNGTDPNSANTMTDVNSQPHQTNHTITSSGQNHKQSDHQAPIHALILEPSSSHQSLADSSNQRLSITNIAQPVDPLNPSPMQANLPPMNSTDQPPLSSYQTQYYTQQTGFEAQMPFASIPEPVLESPTGNRRKLNMTVSSTMDSDDRRISSKRVEPLDTPPDFPGHKKARHSAVHAEPVQMRHPTHLTVSPLSKEPFHHGNGAIPVKSELKSERGDFDPSGKPRLSKHKLKKKLLAAEQDNYEEEKRKREAILQMIDLEKEFNALKEKIFAEKIAQVLKDIEAIHEETHPEFIEQLSKIETVRRNKIASAEKMYEYHVENILTHYNSEKSTMEADFDNEKKQLSDRLNATLQERQKKFEDERNAMLAENGADSRAMLRTLRRRTHEPVPAPPPSIKKKPTMPTIVHPLKEADQIEDLTFIQKALSLPIKVIPSTSPTPVIVAEKGRLIFNNVVFEKGDEVWYEAQGIDRCRCYVLSLGINDVQLRSSDGIKHRLNASQLKAAKFNLERVDK